MPGPHREYGEFQLVDPTRVEQHGVEGATVMTIGVLIQGEYMKLEGNPQQVGVALNRNIADLSHTKTGRQSLQARATDTGTWNFYHCSRCGARLTRTHCAGCRQAYAAKERLSGRQPAMPRKVAAYAISHGHTFTRRR